MIGEVGNVTQAKVVYTFEFFRKLSLIGNCQGLSTKSRWVQFDERLYVDFT